MGQDRVDTDLPTSFELICLNNVFGKVFFAFVSVGPNDILLLNLL